MDTNIAVPQQSLHMQIYESVQQRSLQFEMILSKYHHSIVFENIRFFFPFCKFPFFDFDIYHFADFVSVFFFHRKYSHSDCINRVSSMSNLLLNNATKIQLLFPLAAEYSQLFSRSYEADIKLSRQQGNVYIVVMRRYSNLYNR